MGGFSDSLKTIRISLKFILNRIDLSVLKIYLNRFAWVFRLTKLNFFANHAKKNIHIRIKN